MASSAVLRHTPRIHTWYVPLQGVIILLYGCPYAVIVPPQPHVLYGLCEAPEALYVAPRQFVQLLQSCLRLLLAQDQTLQQVRQILQSQVWVTSKSLSPRGGQP